MVDTQPPATAHQLLADARQLLAQLDGTSLRELGNKAGLATPALEALLSNDGGSSTELQLPAALLASIQQLWQQTLQLAADQQGLSLAALPADARAEIASLKKQLNSLEQQLKARIVAEQTLQKQLGKARIEIATLKSSQLNGRLLEEGAAKEKAHAEQYHKQFEAAKAEIYQLNKALESVRKKHQELSGEQQQALNRLKQELAELSGKADNSDEQQQTLITQRDAEINRLTEQLAARDNEQQQLQQRYEQQLNTLEQQLASERQRAEGLQRQQQQLQEQLQRQQQEHSKQRLDLEEQLAQRPASSDEQQQAQLASLQAEVERLQETLVDRDMTMTDLTQALETAQQAMGSLEGQLLESRHELQHKQQQAANKVVELQDQVKELNSHLRDYHAARSEREELQQSVSELEHKLVESHAQREGLSRFYGRLITDLEVAVMQFGDPAIRAQLNKLVENYQKQPQHSAAAAPATPPSKG